MIDQIKSKILDEKYLEELVRLVNEELDAGHALNQRRRLLTSTLRSTKLKTGCPGCTMPSKQGSLTLDDLAPRIKELRAKQDELSKARVVAEAEMTLQGYQQLDIDAVRSYVDRPSQIILEESEVAQRKAFLRSFVKKIVVDKEKVKLYYNLPVPPDGRKMETVGVLPIDTPSGDRGIRTSTKSRRVQNIDIAHKVIILFILK